MYVLRSVRRIIALTRATVIFFKVYYEFYCSLSHQIMLHIVYYRQTNTIPNTYKNEYSYLICQKAMGLPTCRSRNNRLTHIMRNVLKVRKESHTYQHKEPWSLWDTILPWEDRLNIPHDQDVQYRVNNKH